ncbi:MAG: orotate phosphoribosyltransferase [Gammaproteobacteria bacterium]|nr:orotate phosphoribosyltransferase [Gammaproteobacteria bacterium]
MNDYRHEFLAFAISRGVLRFGEFELKSGRKSPYFFNAGLFNTGEALNQLGEFYARAILQADVQFDMLFGPAYKGIPLVAAVSIALARQGRDVPWCFNRKEAKSHGEGGNLVGAPLAGRVLIVDDVITAGTAIRESLDLIKAHQASPVGIVVSLNRQEKGQGERSAIQEIEQQENIPVISIASLDDLLKYLENGAAEAQYLAAIRSYRERYAVST